MNLKLLFSTVRNTVIRFVILFALLFLVQKSAESQSTVANSFTYGNGISDQISLFRCESSLNLNVQWTNAQINDTLILYFPNSFEILGLSSLYSVTDSTNGFVEIQIPLSSTSGSNLFSFILKNCLNSHADQGSVLNTNNLKFQSFLIHPTINDVVTYTYNTQDMQLLGGTPNIVIFPNSAPTFVIYQGLNSLNFQGGSNQTYSRRFDVRINTPVVDSFLLSISQELDVEHFELRLIDNNLSNGNSGTLVLNNDTGSASILTQINLTTLSNYITSIDTTRVLTFEQTGKLKCLEPNTSSIVRITRPCCTSDLVYFANLNGRIEEGQNFINSSVSVTKVDTTIQNSCSGAYYYDLKFLKTGTVTLIENITVPLNGNFISHIDSVLLVDINNVIHPIESSNIYEDTDTLNNKFVFIDLLSEYDSLSNWNGFIDYADTSHINLDTISSPMYGPWLDNTYFTIRIRFDYSCTSQQECGSNQLYLHGRGVFHENNPFPHNPLSIVQITDSTFLADYRIGLRWWNSCESDTISWLNHRNVLQVNNQAYIDGFVEMDHEMPEADLVSYTFYPSGINPFSIQNNPPSISDLSCDTTVSYRAKFYIPLPSESPDSIQRVNFDVNNIFVGNNSMPIDSIVFLNDSLLFIPLGQNINQPVHFSFDYFLTECPFSDPPNSGGIQLKLEIQAYCDNCEDCYKTVACNALNVVVHCSGSCDGNVPMGTENVHMERSSFGYADLTDFPSNPFIDRTTFIQFVDSVINLTNSSIPFTQRKAIHRDELSKLYPFDLVKLTSEGSITSYSNLISSTNEPFAFNNIAFELAHTPIGDEPFLALKQAWLTFIDTAGVDSFSVPLLIQNVNPQNTGVFGMSGDTLFSFELGIPNITTYTQLTDTNFSYKLRLEAEFWTLPDAVNPINPIIVRGQFICSTNVDSFITTYSCDPWGTQLRVLIPTKQMSIESQTDSLSHCNTNAKISVSIGGGLGDNIDDFPYEFRPVIAYRDTAFSAYFLSGYATHNIADTIWFADSTGFFWNPDNLFLNPIEKPDSQHVYLSGRKFCSSGSDTLPYTLPIYDFAYLTQQHQIDSLFSPIHLLATPPIDLTQYSFFDSVNTSNTTQADIQAINELPWVYSSPAIYDSLIVGLPNSNQILGIADSSVLKYDLHIKAPDSLQLGNCWLSYRFSRSIPNALSLPITTIPYLDSLNYLAHTLALDTLGETFHFFPGGFPIDSLSSTLVMPIECGSLNYRLNLRYGCFCDTASFAFFKIHPDSLPSCVGDSSFVNFQHNIPDVDINSEILVNNDTLGCALTWHIEVENPLDRPNLTQGKLLINIPTGLVLNTNQSTFTYFEQGDTIISQSGNYLNDSIPPHYSFQFEDFPTPPTTVLVLAFPSVNTLHAGSLLTFDLRFKLDQSTCNLDSAIFQSNFLQRILEARFTGYSLCNDSTLFVSENLQQTFINNSISPSLQSQIAAMTDTSGCCMPSAVTVSISHTCSDSLTGALNFHFSSNEGNLVQLYQINDVTNAYISLSDTTIQDTLYAVQLFPGLYSATITTNGGLIYVFNGLQIQNHEVQPHILLTQNSICGGSPITITAVDSNAINNWAFNASNPFIATDTLTHPALLYEWLNTDALVDSIDNSIAVASPLSDTSYSVIISHLSGCIDTANVTVNVNENVQALISGIENTICPSNSFALNLFPLNGSLYVNGIFIDTNFVYPGFFTSDTLYIQYIPDSSLYCANDTVITVFKDETLCNCQPCHNYSAIFDIPSNIETTSQLSALVLNGETFIDNKCVRIHRDLEVDNDFAFTGCKITIDGGVEIKVTARLYLKGDTLQGCEQMWKGIYNLSKLEVNGTIIKDAHLGIHLGRNTQSAYSTILSTEFISNFVGIKTSDSTGNHQLILNNVRFVGGDLLQSYPAQNPIPYAKSLAGIVVTNSYYLSLDPTITFKDLCNGLILNNKCVAQIKRSSFININSFGLNYQGISYWLADPIGTGPFVNTTPNGNGIYAKNKCYVTYSGFGGDVTVTTSFQNCHRAIMVDASSLDVLNTKVSNGRNSVTARFMRGYKLNVNNCYFSNSIKCIDLKFTDQISSAKISSCILITPSTPAPNQVRKGIEVSNYGIANNHTIINNDITSNNGIYLTGAATIEVQKNNILGFGVNGVGINAFKSPKSLFKCNIISGNSIQTIDNQKALSLSSSTSCKISNNTTSNTRYGFEFNLICTTDSFKLNTINTHRIGVRIPATGALGIQNNNGNLWMGNYSNTSGNIGAFAQQNPDIFNPHSRFIVPTNPFPIYYPQTIFPAVGLCAGSFFTCMANSLPLTPSNCNPIGNFIELNDDNELNERILANLAANTTYTFTEFNESLKYQIRREVEKALSSGLLSLPDTGIYVDLIQNLTNSPEREFNQVDRTLQKTLSSLDSEQILNTLYQNLNEIAHEIYLLDSNMVADSAFADTLLNLQIRQANHQLFIVESQIQLIRNLYEQNSELAKDSAILINQGITNTVDFQALEKAVNEIYLNTIAAEHYSFSDVQIQTLFDIANICPSLGGDAVYKARSLFALINDTIRYDDEAICLQQGILYRLASLEKENEFGNNIKLYPNPVQELITIEFIGIEQASLNLQIINATGQMVLNKLLQLNGNKVTENIQHLSAGIYLVKVFDCDTILLKSEKLVKF